MRPLVSRLSQVVRPIALDQSSKILYQSRINSRSPLVGVLRLPAQRASFAPNYFARYQIRAQHTSPDAQTTGTYKKNKTPLGKHYGTPVTTGEIHGTHYGLPIASGKVDRKLKTTGRSSQPPKATDPSAHLFAEKELYRNFEQLLQEYKYVLRREKVDGDSDAKDFALVLLAVITIGLYACIIINEAKDMSSEEVLRGTEKS